MDEGLNIGRAIALTSIMLVFLAIEKITALRNYSEEFFRR